MDMESIQEDYILSVWRYQQRHDTWPGIQNASVYPTDDQVKNEKILRDLERSGDLVITPDGGVQLTGKGNETASTIFRKHKVLESFFEEMLGMDRRSAHEQACSMEHLASEDTIGRLRTFIRSRTPCTHQARCTLQKEGQPCTCIPLSTVQEQETVRVVGIRECGSDVRLVDLGLIPGEQVRVKRRSARTMLISVKGCDIAISPEVADSVFVEREA
jgi:DtxR family transcriptional regulator, Mn-dependent transcriptional regulator